MRADVVVKVESREHTGKNAARRLRRRDRIPGIVYGLGLPPFLVSVSPRRIEEILHRESGQNTVFNLSLADGEEARAAMIKELQRDPASDHLVHVDFIRLDLDRRITVSVPIRLMNTPTGVKNEGGLLDFIHREVEVECLPAEIPEHLDVDVSELHINQHVSVSDVQIGANVRILVSPETVIAVVVAPKAEAAPAEAEAVPVVEEGAEPEVMKRGKETAEEGEGPSKKEKEKEEG
jgi:large subunit ribosomal protein L25